MRFDVLMCDTVPSCDNLVFVGCHALSACIIKRCDNVTTETAHPHVCARTRTGTFLCISVCHSVTSIIKSIAYGVTTLTKGVGIACHGVTWGLTGVVIGGKAMEWVRKSEYSFGSAEGYRVSKTFGMREGALVALYTAWSPRSVRAAGSQFKLPESLGIRLSAAEAVALCEADLVEASKSEVAA